MIENDEQRAKDGYRDGWKGGPTPPPDLHDSLYREAFIAGALAHIACRIQSHGQTVAHWGKCISKALDDADAGQH